MIALAQSSAPFLFAILTIVFASCDVIATNYVFLRCGDQTKYSLTRLDAWSKDWSGAWWTWRIVLWVIIAALVAYTRNTSGGGFVLFLAITLAARSAYRAWQIGHKKVNLDA
jgi:hypothetical protein